VVLHRHIIHVIKTSESTSAAAESSSAAAAAAESSAATAESSSAAAETAAASSKATVILERSSWSTLHKGPHWSSDLFRLQASTLVGLGSELDRFTFLIMVE
jgi:hypothetical protein